MLKAYSNVQYPKHKSRFSQSCIGTLAKIRLRRYIAVSIKPKLREADAKQRFDSRSDNYYSFSVLIVNIQYVLFKIKMFHYSGKNLLSFKTLS